ncbi:MAG: helix-turn-helix transcriptional regulator [Lentisphaeria bacterium]|nr:helix-turn-helix transcriptional regulator [Lentisphaeria bacterium]MBR2719750.1 helix-turn-helix transcriptional regulator [Lentisphaeria bacterium]
MSNSPKVQILNTGFVPAVVRWQYKHASVPTWRFYWNMDPGAWISSRGSEIALTPDIALLIPPQTPFSTRAEKEFAHFFVHFSLPEHFSAERKVHKLSVKDIILPFIAERVSSCTGNELTLAASAVVNAALLMLPEGALHHKEDDSTGTAFDKALSIIEKEPGFSGGCPELARLCGTSVNTLQRQFLKATGLPVKKWLLNRKMEYAVELLMYKGATIKETADKLGFADRYHFSKVFRHYFGISPARFIKSGGIPLP